MRVLQLYGDLLMGGVGIASFVCFLIALKKSRLNRYGTIDDPVYSPEELRRMDIHDSTHKD